MPAGMLPSDAHPWRLIMPAVQEIAHCATSFSAMRTSSWSENGSVSAPDGLTFMAPLPATISVSPARVTPATASWIVLAAWSPIPTAPGAAAMMAARISAGNLWCADCRR